MVGSVWFFDALLGVQPREEPVSAPKAQYRTA